MKANASVVSANGHEKRKLFIYNLYDFSPGGFGE
jgi:hypothetical protein